MPAKFVQVGNNWINLELVTSIEIVEDQSNRATTARVHFSNGKLQDFRVASDIQELIVFLRNHKAT